MGKRQQMTDAQKKRHAQKVEAWKAGQPERDAAEKARKEKLAEEERGRRERYEQQIADGDAEDEAAWARQREKHARVALLPEDEQQIINGIESWDYIDEGEDVTSEPHAFIERLGITDLDRKRAIYALWWVGVFSKPYGPKNVTDDEVLSLLFHMGMDMLHEHIIEVFAGIEKAVPGFNFGSTTEGFEFSYTPPGEEQS
jgi:hypothetical protein